MADLTVSSTLQPAHGDDITITGPEDSLSWLRRAMGREFEITSVLRASEGAEDGVRNQNRTLRWPDNRLRGRPAQR